MFVLADFWDDQWACVFKFIFFGKSCDKYLIHTINYTECVVTKEYHIKYLIPKQIIVLSEITLIE
jgi:hypothetical protein